MDLSGACAFSASCAVWKRTAGIYERLISAHDSEEIAHLRGCWYGAGNRGLQPQTRGHHPIFLRPLERVALYFHPFPPIRRLTRAAGWIGRSAYVKLTWSGESRRMAAHPMWKHSPNSGRAGFGLGLILAYANAVDDSLQYRVKASGFPGADSPDFPFVFLVTIRSERTKRAPLPKS